MKNVIMVEYHGGMGAWDGCTENKVYEAIQHSKDSDRYIIDDNDFGAQSILLKSKFKVLHQSPIQGRR